MREVPVYLFTGFMDSGKTTLICHTLFEEGFADGTRTLLIVCEDGEKEYDEAKLKEVNITVCRVEKEEDLTEELLERANNQCQPDQIFIEFNGMWHIDTLLDLNFPDDWIIMQSMATVDASTFDMYLDNMRPMVMEQLFKADVVIFNRSGDDTPKGRFRRVVKTANRPAQIVYERADGTVDTANEELPFDLDQDVIEICDADYVIWYMDAQENYQKYDGKKVEFTALIYNPEKLKPGIMVPGRFALTCCVEDVAFLGFKCKYPESKRFPHKSWVHLVAEIRVEFAKEYKGKGPVLYPVSIEPVEMPDDEFVYFS